MTLSKETIINSAIFIVVVLAMVYIPLTILQSMDSTMGAFPPCNSTTADGEYCKTTVEINNTTYNQYFYCENEYYSENFSVNVVCEPLEVRN